MAKEKIENEKLVAILSYFLVGIIWYFVDEKMKKSEFVKFHVKQSLILVIISFVSWIPIIGWILGLIALIGAIMGIISAANGTKKDMPLIGKYAKKFKF